MDTPYGSIPERFARDMAPEEMHEYLRRRVGRRGFLKLGAAAGLVASGPVLWLRSDAWAEGPPAPQWISYGADPTRQLNVSWSTGTAGGTRQTPPAPQIRWGLDTGYGARRAVDRSGPVPVPSSVPGEPVENTVYNNVLLSGLKPGTTYHYSVSDDGVHWGPDTTFRTATAGVADFRFAAFGDHGAHDYSTAPMARLVAALRPAFCVVAGDLSYATPQPLPIPNTAGFDPSAWDRFLGILGPSAAQSIPWQVGVGTHEIEPLLNNGYDGLLTRFPQPYDRSSGSPVVHTFTHGNVAFIQLDGNDLSAQATQVNGYTGGAQTAWLERKLAAYRAPTSCVDFIVVVFGNCVFSTNQNHGSDGGIRAVWEPLFDRYHVDLVINGHVHAYERTHPMRAGQPTRKVPPGGTVHSDTDGTTFICAGGAGQGLYGTWYGTSGGGDAGDTTTPPKVWQWTGGSTARGGSGQNVDLTDTAADFSAFRRAHWHCLVIDVTAPRILGGDTRMHVRALDPAQTASGITDITNPAVMDSVTLVRRSRGWLRKPTRKAGGRPAAAGLAPRRR
jgi:hypothetical protein